MKTLRDILNYFQSPERKAQERKPSKIRSGNLILVLTGQDHYQEDRKGNTIRMYGSRWVDPSRYDGATLREIRRTHR